MRRTLTFLIAAFLFIAPIFFLSSSLLLPSAAAYSSTSSMDLLPMSNAKSSDAGGVQAGFTCPVISGAKSSVCSTN